MIHIHSYTRTLNLGDAVQTLALVRLLGSLRPGAWWWHHIDRDAPAVRGVGEQMLINGFLDDRWRPTAAQQKFVGIHCANARTAARVVARADQEVVGARDPQTVDLIEAQGGKAEFVGCATLTLEAYHGPRSGVYFVDADAQNGGQTQKICETMPWPEQLKAAADAIERWRTASAVYTSRLHVLLPCIAMGTPVALVREPCPFRFGVARYMGVRPGMMPQVYNCDALAAKYRAMIEESLHDFQIM